MQKNSSCYTRFCDYWNQRSSPGRDGNPLDPAFIPSHCRSLLETLRKSDCYKIFYLSDSVLPDVAGLEAPLIEFVQKFISAFDNDREALYHCYAPEAVFTLGVGRGDTQSYRKHQRNMINFNHFKNSAEDRFRQPRKLHHFSSPYGLYQIYRWLL